MQGSQRLPAAPGSTARRRPRLDRQTRRARARFPRAARRDRVARQPLLLPWLQAPAARWSRRRVVAPARRGRLAAGPPAPGVYLRQVDLPGIHNSSSSNPSAACSPSRDLALPAAAIDLARTGAQQFAARHGFPGQARAAGLRVLDPALGLLPVRPAPDLAPRRRQLCPPATRRGARLHHRERDQLPRLSRVDKAIVIFGRQLQWEALARGGCSAADPLLGATSTPTVSAILAQCAPASPCRILLLMDRATLLAHEAVVGQEDRPRRPMSRASPPRNAATTKTCATTASARPCAWSRKHIGFGWLEKWLKIVHLMNDFQPYGGDFHPPLLRSGQQSRNQTHRAPGSR